MRLVIKIVFALAFLVLNVCLINPMVNRGMSWEEAGFGIIPGAFVSLICFLLLVAGVGVKDKSGSGAVRWWAAALLWSLIVGGVVTFVTTSSYANNRRSVYDEPTSISSRRSSSSLDEAYARYDQIGMMYGWTTLGFAGISLVGLIVSLALRKKVAAPTSGT